MASGKHLLHHPKGSPLLLILMMLTVLPSVVLADAWGAGAAGIIGGLTGLFSLVVFIGGPLRADLRIAAVMGPLLIFAAAVPRLVAEASRPAAIVLVVLLGFVAALLPLLGPRFANAGMGLGMTTVFGYGYAPNGGADHQQVIAAAVAGVAVALALRVLMGISDPSKPTREQIAQVLVADDSAAATSTAFGTWISDGRQRWLADVLDAASRYRLALRAAELSGTDPDAIAAMRDRAKDLAGRLQAKPSTSHPSDPDKSAQDPSVQHAPVATSSRLADASDALDDVERAIREHDTSAVPLEHDSRHQFKDAVLHPSARLRSVQLRHGFRTALGLLIMLIITSGLNRGDPLVSTAMLATFSILQASWRDTLTKATNKIIGLVGGSLLVAVILLTVPSRFLTPIAGVALCMGLWFIVTRPALGQGCMVVVSVGFNSVTRDLNATNLLLQYVGLTAAAVVVGLVVGFAVVPAFRPPPLRRRIESATEATTAALRAAVSGETPGLSDAVALHREAAQQQEELVPDHEKLDDQQLTELDRLRTGLHDLTVLVDATRPTPAELDEVLLALSPTEMVVPDGPGSGTGPEQPRQASSTAQELAQQTGEAERYLLRTLPAGV
ncbi:FUSC family protein [Aeromicrobium sp. S22]|uniref:FUSC family protein n=1 Tax=Aeromicrobium sp. S22 TaxID=2662029 RepID=UPI00129ED2F6|nr:FUSC family protein [Aeromicrobium sp. S22]MRK02714.1 FUSC family protein [Aeromicrobium sp. S22]